MTSRPLKSTGPDALTTPSLSQAHGTLIVTDYPPTYPPYLSPIPPIYLWRQIFVTDIFVETIMRYAAAHSMHSNFEVIQFSNKFE